MTEFQNCYVIQWTIENFSMCLQKKGQMMESPYFQEPSQNEEWSIKLYPRGFDNEDFLSLELCNRIAVTGTLNFTVSVIDRNGFPHFPEELSTSFLGPACCLRILEFSKRCDLFEKKALLLPNDILTIRCIIRKPYRMHSNNQSIKIEKLSFTWPITNFSAIKANDKNLTYPIRVKFDNAPEFNLEFSCVDNFDDKLEICVRFNKLSYYRKKFYVFNNRYPISEIDYSQYSIYNDINISVLFEICIMNNDGSTIGFFRDDHVFLASKRDETYCPKGVNINKRLTNDSLTLQVSMQFSDGSRQTFSNFTDTELPQPQNIKSLNTIHGTMCKRLYEERKFCDVSFKVGDEVLHAHKAVLHAQSPVFQAMFDSNMTEQNTGVIDIVDFDAATMKRFLELLYTGRVDETLHCQDLLKLYAAGHKYQVPTLEIVRPILISKIDVQNAWEVCSSAAKYDDAVFEAAKSYISEHTLEALDVLMAAKFS